MIGQKVHQFTILSKLGEGGMGEVYLARDDRLDREVALKFISSRSQGSEQVLTRFAREARAASALNHPNILTIYEIGEYESAPYMAVEVVDGGTLRDLLEKGPLSSKQAIEIARQVAGALMAAHGEGILHRDIKPENIMVRSDGLVKVVDFGLAKLFEDDGSDSNAPTVTLTRAGAVVGTAAYMSPEQARGEATDERSDLFSLGVVLYEMLAGTSPFRREAVGSTYEALLNHTPPPFAQRLSLHEEIDWIVGRALEKDKTLRFQSARDLKSALDRVHPHLSTSGSGVARATPGPSGLEPLSPTSADDSVESGNKVWPGLVAAGAVGLVLGLLAQSWLLGGSAVDPFDASRATFQPLTEEPGLELFPTLSPDGRFLAYEASPEGNRDIFFRRVGGGTPINLTAGSTADDSQPAFSPDGERLAFRSERSGGGIYVMGATGEDARRVVAFGNHPAWSPDGTRLAICDESVDNPGTRSPASRIWVVDVESGDPTELPVVDGVQPTWSTDGTRIAYWGVHRGGQRDLWTIAVDGGVPRLLTDDPALDWNPVWDPDGRHLYFISDRGGTMALWRLAVDPTTGSGSDLEALPTPSIYSQHISLSADGSRVAYVALDLQSQVEAFDFDSASGVIEGSPLRLLRGARSLSNPTVSGAGAIVMDSTGTRQEDLYLLAPDRRLRRLTDDPPRDRAPRFLPDGRIVFFSDRDGSWEVFVIRDDGSELTQLTRFGKNGAQAPIPSPDGQQLLINRLEGPPVLLDLADPDSAEEVPWLELASDGTGSPFMWPWSWAPDGSLLGYGETLEFARFGEAEARRLETVGSRPVWLPDGERFLYVSSDGQRLVLSRLDDSTERQVISVAPDLLQGYSLSPDGRRLVIVSRSTTSDVWLLDRREK